MRGAELVQETIQELCVEKSNTWACEVGGVRVERELAFRFGATSFVYLRPAAMRAGWRKIDNGTSIVVRHAPERIGTWEVRAV